MELIEALEQLSIQVRANRLNLAPTNNASNSTSWLDNKRHDDGNHQSQLQEFDSSIATLFYQLNDLDQHELTPTNDSVCSSTRIDLVGNNRRELPNNYHFFNRSVELSQEEDSDNSSTHQNSYATSSSCSSGSSHNYTANSHHQVPYVNPLVVNLMKRDICAITDTVRKIGRILTIGSQIESIYKKYFLQYNEVTSTNQADMDINHCRSLCDTFISLCSSEPCICDLPTILHYNEYCQLMMRQLNYLMPPLSVTTARIHLSSSSIDQLRSSSSNLHETNDKINAVSADDNNVSMCLDDARDALDCALLECDQEQLDVTCWTNNKLYINQINDQN